MKSNMMQSTKLFIGAVSVLGLLSACSGDSTYDFEPAKANRISQIAVAPVFDPSNGQLPLPNDLLFLGSTDGTLNIPGVADDTNYGDPQVALNTLDGFSTIEPIVANFAQQPDEPSTILLDASTVVLQDTVRVFEVTRAASGAVTGIVEELAADKVAAQLIPLPNADGTITSPNGTSLAVVPIVPLKESTTYMVMVTNGLQDENGTAIQANATFRLAAGETDLVGEAAGLQGLIRAMLAAGASAEVSPDDVILAWSFTTQSITPTLQAVKDAAVSSPITVAATGLDTSALSESSPGLADIYAGRMTLPYYLSTPSTENPTAPLNAFWQNASGSFLTPIDNTPVAQTNVEVPVLLTKPKGTAPAGGWPIAIFQHGITRNRTDMLAIADAMAAAQFAVVAIDIPMHGITEDNTVMAGFRVGGIERTFDVDYVNNETSAPGPDGVQDSSGTHFYNLANLLNTRDNTRQAIADLFTLSASVGTIADINPAQKVFIGHSLGAIVGTSMLGFDNSFVNATLLSPGAGLSRLLAGSPTFGPTIQAGLAGAGVTTPEDLNSFLNAAQAAVDSADPINHAARISADTNVHLVQIDNDVVVVNNLAGFPLVGTEAIARVMQLPPVSTTTQGSGFVRFATGYHGSVLTPADSNPDDDITAEQAGAAFLELQSQTSRFAATGTIIISNEDIIVSE